MSAAAARAATNERSPKRKREILEGRGEEQRLRKDKLVE